MAYQHKTRTYGEYEQDSNDNFPSYYKKQKRFIQIYNPEESVLASVYAEPDRPYAPKELQQMKDNLFRSLGLDAEYVMHSECGHRYNVKSNGMKFKQLLERKNESSSEEFDRDCGNCSVCWKITRTPRGVLQDKASEFVDLFHEQFVDLSSDIKYSYYTYEILRIYYTWLYKEDFVSNNRRAVTK